jgi:hypothetical protein
MSDDLRTTLRTWLTQLTLDPIDPCAPGETRYVALQESGRGAVDEIYATIDRRTDTTTQLLSGPNGSGKTTELYRLKGTLENAGFTVAIVDILQFVNRSSPIDITGPAAQAGFPGRRPVRRGRWLLPAGRRGGPDRQPDIARARAHCRQPGKVSALYLSGALPYDGRVQPVPIPQVRNSRGEIDDNAKKSIAELTDVVSRRIPWQELLGEGENLGTVIFGSLGHSFASVTSEKAAFLRKVAAAMGVIEPSENEVHLMARLMDTHMLLGHLNHRDWYEVHPLARRALDLP